MKYVRTALYFLFGIFQAAFLGLGMTCLLNLLGVALAVSLDGRSVIAQYPRFIPFCLVVGLLSLVILAALVVLNVIVSKKLKYTKIVWIYQSAGALVLSIPMGYLWEKLIDFLQTTF